MKRHWLIILALCLGTILLIAFDNREQSSKQNIYFKHEIIIIQENPEKYEYKKCNNRIVNYILNWVRPYYFERVSLYRLDLVTSSIGYYYITAYAAEECGYNGYNFPTGWTTASGAICHRADYENRLTEPTTCAIDRRLHRFGDTFYIPAFDRVFVAEDTGSAVKGKHLDLFYDYYGMLSFPTGYYEVFTFEYVYSQTEVSYYAKYRRLSQERFLHEQE